MSNQPSLLSPPAAKNTRRITFWLGLSLAVAAFYGCQSLQYAFSSPYIVQDDARQHVFWMWRFLDPGLFRNDLIADYFQSVAPVGPTILYQLVARVGVAPLVLNKILPLVLGAITTGYCFGVFMQLLPVPAGAFLATLMLNQSLWLEDDLVSATPRAFFYPLFLAFLYYLLRRSRLLVTVAISLEGLFYPPAALLSVTILTLRLWQWQGLFPRLRCPQRSDFWFWGSGLVVAVLVLLPYELVPNPFGPVVTVAQAKLQPEFLQVGGVSGRALFFHENPLVYWLFGPRTGMLFFLPPLVWAAFALPLWLRSPRFRLASQVRGADLLTQIFLASLGLFFLAHVFLFHLHFPSRYTYHSLRVLAALAAGIAWTLWLELRLKQIQAGLTNRQFLFLGLTVLLATLLAIAPFFPQLTLPEQFQVVGDQPQLYRFLLQQPKDTLVASVSEEVNNLPSFAARSILVGREYALPYHTRYYAQIRQRTIDLIQAQYSPNLAQVQGFIQKYDVDFFLLDAGAFTPGYLMESQWLNQFQPATQEALTGLQRREAPALSKLVDRCSALTTERLVLVRAKCIGDNTF